MTRRTVHEYAAALRPRFRTATKGVKKRVLDEFWQTTGVRPKAASRLLGRETRPRSRREGVGPLGVMGLPGSGVGVAGDSEEFMGVAGHTSRGIAGVVGFAPGEIPGVMADSQEAEAEPGPCDGGLALLVSGRAAFLTAGAAVVPAKAKGVWVPNGAVRADSHITVAFTADPGNAATVVQWVERDPGKGFTAHLSTPPPNDVPFTYLVVEPAPHMPGS
jgi:hypothetical protein